MTSLLRKAMFLVNRPSVVFIIGREALFFEDYLKQILDPYFHIKTLTNDSLTYTRGQRVLYLSFFSNLMGDTGLLEFMAKFSRHPVLILHQFSGTDEMTIERLARTLPKNAFLLLNWDNENSPKIRELASNPVITYGMKEGSDVRGTDIKMSGGRINFKVNYGGSSVPLWIAGEEREKAVGALMACAVGVIKAINLVEISQQLK